jgi:hypothetical protein
MVTMIVEMMTKLIVLVFDDDDDGKDNNNFEDVDNAEKICK